MSTLTPQDLHDQIVAERGGPERFTAVQSRLVFALVTALAKPADIDPSTVAKLLSQLPPVVGDSPSNSADVDAMYESVVATRGVLSVEQRAVCRALAAALVAVPIDMPLVERLGAMLPPPTPPKPTALDVTFRNAGPDAEDRLRERIGDLERENRRLRVYLPRAGHAPVESDGEVLRPDRPSNVTPLHSLEVTTTLRERYPFGGVA
jgi:hypothetical protein